MQPFTFFISYRREETAPIALLLKYEIEKRVQFVRVFVDVEEIQPAEVFPNRLESMIGEAHATIVLIGRHWMPRRGQSTQVVGTAEKCDWVQREIERSQRLPIKHDEANKYGLDSRLILPLFVNCERHFDQFQVPETIADITTLQGERIDYAEWPHAIGPLVERIAVRLTLKKRPDADEYPTPDRGKARTQPVSDAELRAIIEYEDYEGWYVDNFGNSEVRYLAKTFKFRNFNQAADFMERVANHCRILNHHPEWRNVFNHVTVSLTTWDARRRVTIYDLNLALFMNKAAEAVRRAST